jgi:6-phosphogluconolactonase (cycloisomerase 2 family)
MSTFSRLAVGASAIVTFSAFAAPIAAGASGPAGGPDFGGRGQHPVFVQTDGIAGNQVVAYDRAPNGTLTLAATYATGGLGGVLNGSQVDHLGSQGSLTYDAADSLLYAVNAGSNSVSVFSVRGDQLSLRQVVSSGGVFPVSVAVHGHLVAVLNAQNGGSVQEFYSLFGHLVPLPGSNRNLGLTIPSDATQFTHTPGQVAFSPDGSKLIVTTKATTNAIDVFAVGLFGILSRSPVTTVEPGAVPFALAFDRTGHLVVGEAGPSALATFNLNRNGTLSPISVLASGQTGLCWVTATGSLLYTGNTAANSTSGYVSSAGGQLSLLGATTTDPGTVDGSVSSDGHFLYVQTGGNGIVDEFQLDGNGSLTEVGSTLVPGAVGGQGIAAT